MVPGYEKPVRDCHAAGIFLEREGRPWSWVAFITADDPSDTCVSPLPRASPRIPLDVPAHLTFAAHLRAMLVLFAGYGIAAAQHVAATQSAMTAKSDPFQFRRGSRAALRHPAVMQMESRRRVG